MTGTAKRLRPDDLRILQEFRRKRLRAFVRDTLLLMPSLGIVMLIRAGTVFYKGTVPHIVGFNAYFAYVIVGFMGLCLAIAPLCSLFIRFFRVHALPRVLQWQNILFLNLYMLVSIPIILLITTVWKPFQLLNAGFFGDIAGECSGVALVTCILLFLTRGVLPLPRFSQFIYQIFIGIALAIVLSFILGLLIPFAGLSVRFDKTQLWQGGILFVMLWPIFLLYESVVHNWHERDSAFAFLLSFSVRVCFLVVIYVFVMFSQDKKFIELVWPIPVVVFLFLQHCCFVLYRKGRAAIAGATLSTCITAWLLTSHLTPVNL
jgi:hypothetical protein